MPACMCPAGIALPPFYSGLISLFPSVKLVIFIASLSRPMRFRWQKTPSSCLLARETAAMIETMRLNEINNYTVRRSDACAISIRLFVDKLSTERRRDLPDKIGDEN